MTEFEKRKQDMKELWKETFHDSNRYIDLVFDTYYSIENSFVRYHENRIIAAMLCVAYEFQILTTGGSKRLLKGMYLCGLATRPEWRRKGIMADLMKEAEEDIRSRGYDLTFLIPADDHLRTYYEKKGYQNASWRHIKNFRPKEHPVDSHWESPHIYSIGEFFKEGKTEFLDQLAEWCREIEHSRLNNTILHSREDFLTIMAENENSILLSSPTFNPEFPILTKVIGVAFPELPEIPKEALRLVGLFYQPRLTQERLMEIENTHSKTCNVRKNIEPHDSDDEFPNSSDKIKNDEEYIASEILNSILKAFNQQSLELIVPYLGQYAEERGAEPYAMIKQLRETGYVGKNENLEFEISLMLD